MSPAKPASPPLSSSSALKKGHSTGKTSVKKVDAQDLPPPSPPKRARRNSDESVKSTKSTKSVKKNSTSSGKKAAGHVKAKQSISSFNQVLKQVTAATPTPTSPSGRSQKGHGGSSMKPVSKAYTNDEGDFDDGVSVADSSISTHTTGGGRVRRNESERIEYFKNQPEAGKMEPRAIECLRCGKMVALGKKQTYAVRPWEIHRGRCDQRPAVDRNDASASAPPSAKKANTTAGDNNAQDPNRSISRAGSIADPSPARRLTEQERKTALESDKQIEAIEAHRVLCRKCHDWVQLSEKHAYVTGNWFKHKIQCSDHGIVPSSRVVTAKRKLVLVNDSQVKSFDAKRVECAYCHAHVELKGEGEYNVGCWEEHKMACKRPNSKAKAKAASATTGTNSVPFPSASRPPPSSASTNTERTLIAPESPNGLKRAREEVQGGVAGTAADEERPTNRARSDSYVPQEGEEAPGGALGWLLLPFQAFARGFRESLKNGSSA